MGKRKGGGGKRGSKYVHSVTHNAEARESGERRLQMLRNLEIKRLTSIVEKQRQHMTNYFPPEVVAKKKQKVDPAFDLKGAARPAREVYCPGADDEFDPVDLLDSLTPGKLWEHEEGQSLLRATLNLGVALHNVGNRTKEAIRTFQSMQEMDPADHLLARHRLLGCYLDLAEAEMARSLLDAHPADKSCYFTYTRALLEYLSLQLKEAGSSEKLRDDELLKAYTSNPYALFALANHEIFFRVVNHASLIAEADEGSVEDALRFFSVNLDLWLEIDGVILWIKEFIIENDLAPPLIQLEEDAGEEDEELKKEAGTEEGNRKAKDGGGLDDGGEDEEEEDDVGEEEDEGEEEENAEQEDEAATIARMSDSERHDFFLTMFGAALEAAYDEEDE